MNPEPANRLYCPPERPRPLRIMVDQVATSVQLCLSPHCNTLVSLIEGAPTSKWPRTSNVGWPEVVAASGGAVDYSILAPYTCGLPLAPFLTAVLRDPAPVFQEQLREIEEIDPETVRTWLDATFGDEPPDTYRPFRAAPDRALRRMSEVLQAYFDAVISPLWPSLRAFLDREIIRVGYLLATRPAEIVLSSLHPSMRVHANELVVEGQEGPLSGTLIGRRLKLTPLVSTSNAILVDFNGGDEIKVGYAAAGVEEFWAAHHEPNADLEDELVRLLGETRAAILAALDVPDSTTTLAHRLHVAPATISEHLSVLTNLGLVRRSRRGRHVDYGRTARGDSLLTLFRQPTESKEGTDRLATSPR